MLGITGTGIHEQTLISIDLLPQGSFFYWRYGAVGIGTGIGAVLSCIPEGACACGAEGRMASIGPPALGAKGCVERLRRFAQGATAVEGAFKFIEGVGLYKTIQPPCGRRKCIPPLVAGATTFPPLRGGTMGT